MLAFLYRWHRRLALTALIPVIVWTSSGITHPLMAVAKKPQIATDVVPRQSIALESHLPLRQVLEQAQITDFNNARIATLKGRPHYQVQTGATEDSTGGGIHRYFEVETGAERAGADQAYARELARGFLGDSAAKITDISKITSWTGLYVEINRLLPVYRIQFDRDDGIELYVHTGSDRLGTANDTWRKANLWYFAQGHVWSWLGGKSSPLRVTVTLALSVIALFVALTGLLLFGVMFKNLRRAAQKGKTRGGLRRVHRILGLAVSLSMLGFTASGLLFVTGKYSPVNLEEHFVRNQIQPDEIKVDPIELASNCGRPIHNIGLARVGDSLCFQLHVLAAGASGEILYFDAATGAEIEGGDEAYAVQLASEVAGVEGRGVDTVTRITEFHSFYPFVMKRLPVQSVLFDGPGLKSVAVETGTGHMASHMDTMELVRTITFLNLHKYHFLDGLVSASGRDLVMGFFSFLLLVVAILGFVVYLRAPRHVNPDRS